MRLLKLEEKYLLSFGVSFQKELRFNPSDVWVKRLIEKGLIERVFGTTDTYCRTTEGMRVWREIQK